MENVSLNIKIIFAAVFAFIGEIVGGFDKLLVFLLICMGFDVISGLLGAVLNKDLSSKVMYKGAFKKVGMLLIVGLAHGIDGMLITDTVMRSAVIGYFIATEGISLLENLGAMGVPLPPKILDILQNLKGQDEEK